MLSWKLKVNSSRASTQCNHKDVNFIVICMLLGILFSYYNACKNVSKSWFSIFYNVKKNFYARMLSFWFLVVFSTVFSCFPIYLNDKSFDCMLYLLWIAMSHERITEKQFCILVGNLRWFFLNFKSSWKFS